MTLQNFENRPRVSRSIAIGCALWKRSLHANN